MISGQEISFLARAYSPGIHTAEIRISKNRTNPCNNNNGPYPKTSHPPEPSACDDASVDAGDQAAATLSSGSGELRGRRTRAQPAAGTARRGGTGPGRSSAFHRGTAIR